MKSPLKLLQVTLVILAVAAFYSCEKSVDEGLGTAEFAVSMSGGELKSGTIGDSVVAAYQLMVSIQDLQGNPVLTDKLIPLYAFGTGFISEKIEIKTGEFKLVKFMVINPSGTVIFASPVAGSPLAYLTTRPLPFIFSIQPGRVSQVIPEVLPVGNNTPGNFGYASFGVAVIKPLTFWAGAVIDNPMIMAPFPLFTEAKLTVLARDGWRYTFKLFAGVNQLVVRGGSDIYSLVLEKEGFMPQKFQFTAAQLLATKKEAPLYLKIPYNDVVLKKLVLQPGPDGGKDAMVSNLEPDKNFGLHKFFEATFLSEPVLTVMRENRSLIWFNLNQLPKSATIRKVVLKLSFELPVAWDSSVIAASVNPNTGTSNNVTTDGSPIIQTGCVLQQITEPWEEMAVTWNKQPASTELNQVFIAPFIRNVNFIEIDVTRLFISPIPTANSTLVAVPNHGMKFMQKPAGSWPGMRFASSDHPNMVLRPTLTVYYSTPVSSN